MIFERGHFIPLRVHALALHDARLWILILFLLAGYYACLLYCERGVDEGREL